MRIALGIFVRSTLILQSLVRVGQFLAFFRVSFGQTFAFQVGAL